MADDLIEPPHIGIEFDLLDQNKKHIAFFYDIIPDLYDRYKNLPEYSTIEWNEEHDLGTRHISIPYVILYRKGYEKEAQRFFELQMQIDENFFENGEAIIREEGVLLSYPPESTERYIEW